MSKLVDLKRLQQLAEGLDARMKAKVSAEESRAKGVEEGLSTKVGTLEGKVAALEAGTYDDAEVRGLISDNADAIAAIEADYLKAADKTELEGSISDVSEVAQAAKDSIDAFLKDADMTEKAVDTLKELQEYMSSDGAAAEQMLASIASKVSQEAYDAKVAELEAADAQVLVDAKAYADQAELDAVAAAEAKDAALKAELEGQIKVKADQSALKDVDDRVKDLEDAKDDYKSYADAAEADAIASAKAYADGELAKKADASAVYTKEEVNSSINAVMQETSRIETALGENIAKKANASDVYTKSEADGKFLTAHQDISGKADKSEVEAALELKADKSYVDEELAKKANESVVNAALELKADASALTDLTGEVALKAVKSEVEAALATKAVKTEVDTALLGKVDKVDGYSLMSADEHTKLAGLENYNDSSVKQRLDSLEAIKHEEFAKAADVNTELAKKAAQADLVALQGVVANKVEQDDIDSAITQEVSDRNAAIAKVVQSLDVAVTEEGKIVLSLGGQESGFEICSKELPFATDKEIADIIAGLDATPEA